LPDWDRGADWHVVVESFFEDVDLLLKSLADFFGCGLDGLNQGGFLFFVKGSYV